jgi:hypothetical protein
MPGAQSLKNSNQGGSSLLKLVSKFRLEHRILPEKPPLRAKNGNFQPKISEKRHCAF